MKKFAIGTSIAAIVLFGFVFIGLNHAQADQVFPLTTPVVLSPAQEGITLTDAVILKQALDVLKKTLDLIQTKIDTTSGPISNAVAINSSLSELKTSLRQVDSTLAALSHSSNLAANQNTAEESGVKTQSPFLSSDQSTTNNQLASVESAYDLKKLTWPAIAVLAVIVAALIMIVLRRKMVKSKIAKVQKNIQEIKEKVAVKPAVSQQSQSVQKSEPTQQNVGL
jgi:hypothetical protein